MWNSSQQRLYFSLLYVSCCKSLSLSLSCLYLFVCMRSSVHDLHFVIIVSTRPFLFIFFPLDIYHNKFITYMVFVIWHMVHPSRLLENLLAFSLYRTTFQFFMHLYYNVNRFIDDQLPQHSHIIFDMFCFVYYRVGLSNIENVLLRQNKWFWLLWILS